MSGFAAINGEPDGGPLLPPIALTDEVTALVAAFATMVALHSGVGQVVDVNLLESLFQLMGPLIERLPAHRATCSSRGSARASRTRCRAAPTAAPTARWVAISASAETVAVAGDGAARRWATTRASPPSPAGSSTATSSTASWPAVHRRPLAGRGAGHVRGRPRRRRPVMTMADIAADPHCRERGIDRRPRRHADAGPGRPPVGHARRACAGPAAPSTPTAPRSAPSSSSTTDANGEGPITP